MNDAADQDKPVSPAADAEAPAPKRRRTTAKAAAEAAAPEATPEAAEAPVPVKRTRRKAAETAAEEAAPAPEAAPADEAPAPARKRAPRKTAAAAEEAAPVVAAEASAPATAAPAPVFTLAEAASAAAAAGGDDADEDGDGEGEGGEDGERGGRSRNRRRNRKERAERQAAVQATGGGDAPGAATAPELVEAAGARFADVLSGNLDAESEGPLGEPPQLRPEPEETVEEAGEGETKRVLAPDADAPKLQKVLAQAGIGSRRDIEDWISEGKIEVNGEVAHVGQRISFGDRVRVNGKEVRVRISPPNPRILAYHKPTGEVSTFNDPEGRPTVFRSLPRVQGQKWQSVGRLDINTEGLLLFTNSGELANQLMHPRFGVEREYAARVLGSLSDEQRAKLLEGVNVDGQTAAFKAIEDGGGEGANRWYRVTITEGRNREVRKLFEAVGMVVSRLIRIRYGTVVLPRGLKRGVWVELGDDDVRVIRRLAGHTNNSGQGQQQGHGQGHQQGQGKGQQQPQGNKNDRNKRRNEDRHAGVGPRPSRPPEPQQPRPPREERAQRRDDDEEDDGFIPHHVNPLEQTFDRRHATSGKRGLPQGFGAGGSQQHDRPKGGGNKGNGPREPDPMQTSVGYIGGDAYLRRGGGGGRGGKGGGGGGGGGGRSGGGYGGRR